MRGITLQVVHLQIHTHNCVDINAENNFLALAEAFCQKVYNYFPEGLSLSNFPGVYNRFIKLSFCNLIGQLQVGMEKIQLFTWVFDTPTLMCSR